MTLTAPRFLDPRADVVFKKIFGHHADLLMSFLNSVMPFDSGRKIVELTYLNPEQAPEIPEFKHTIVDVKCKDQNGRIFIIEMQMEWSVAFGGRMLYNVSKAFVQQLNKGDKYDSLCPVYGLALLNEKVDDSPEWYHHYRMQHTKDVDKTLDGIEVILLELAKFQPATWGERRLGVLWLRFLSEVKDWQILPEEFTKDPNIAKACELAQVAAYNPAELAWYDKYWDAISTERTKIAAGEDRGEAKGLAAGRVEGELHKALEVAQALIDDGMKDEFIIRITGLTAGQIARIRRP